MKAKEIAQRVLENLATGEVTVDEAYETELVADIQRFQQVVKDRKITTGSKSEISNRIGLQAWMRLCNEFNVKWNAVADQLMKQDGRYIHPQNAASFIFGKDAFVHAFAGAMFRDLSPADRDRAIQNILSMNTASNLSKWDVQRQFRLEQDDRFAREFMADYRKRLFGV